MENNIFPVKLVRYFVYIIQDTRVKDPIIYQIGDHTVQFNYKPIYVGRGCGNRHMSHIDDSHNPEINKFIENNPNHYLIEKVITDLSWQKSVILEQGLIYTIGRLDLNAGPLLNNVAGIHWNEDNLQIEPSPLNLELNKLKLILERLNSLSNRSIVAKSLGISERTLYRMINDYQIKKIKIKKDTYEYYQI